MSPELISKVTDPRRLLFPPFREITLDDELLFKSNAWAKASLKSADVHQQDVRRVRNVCVAHATSLGAFIAFPLVDVFLLRVAGNEVLQSANCESQRQCR